MKKQLLFYIVMAAIFALPINLKAQRNDNWFNSSVDDYTKRDDDPQWSDGLGNQGFGQEPEAPLGSGLLVMLVAGAGYTALKTKKRRKNTGIMMMALVMMLGLSQCKKQIPTVNQDSVYDGPTTNITLSLSSGDSSKVGVNLHFSTSSEAPVTYEKGDKIEVAYKGKWVGTLNYSDTSAVTDQNGNHLGIFSGTITTDAPTTGTDPLYFYFLGNKTPTKTDDGAYDKITVDISDQSKELPVISYAASQQMFSSETSNYTVEYNWLMNQCALVKFDAENIYDMSNNANDNNSNALYKTTQAITLYGLDNQVTVRLSKVGTNSHFNWAQIGSDETAGSITMYRDEADTEGAYRYAIIKADTTYDVTVGDLNVAFNRSSDPCGYYGTYKLQGEVKLNDFFQSTTGSKDGDTKQAKLDLVWHSGAISIGDGSYVVFSRGNVQYANLEAGTSGTANYRPAGTWRFAKHQYDFVGGMDNNNTHQSNVVKDETGSSATMSNNENVGNSDYDGWIDMFGWGTGNAPTQTTTTNTWYTNTNGFHDWGANNIVNSGKPGNTAWWTTLTHTEWNNVISRNKEAKVGLATITGSLYGNTVGYTNATDVPGLVILPDNFTNPYSWKPVSEGTLSNKAEYSDNTYTLAQWTEMEKAGAVFLPAAGWRNDTDGKWRATITVGKRDLEHGCYQSSTKSTSAAVWQLRFGTDYETGDRINDDYAMAPDNGHCVRLVHRLN